MFSFSLVTKTIKESMTMHVSDEELINLLIEDIVKSNHLESKTGELLYIDKKAASNIMNNKVDVPKQIRGSLNETSTSIESLEKHLRKAVIPLLIPEKYDSVYQTLSDEIGRCKNVPKKITDEIAGCEKIDDYARLLAIALRYSFVLSNKLEDEIKTSSKGVADNEVDQSNKLLLEKDANLQRENLFIQRGAKPPMMCMLEYLSQPLDWSRSYSPKKDIRYYKYAPEFTIEHTYESENGLDGHEYYLFSQTDSTPHWVDVQLKYHQTVLYHTQGAILDGGRYFTPCPDWGVVRPGNGFTDNIVYKYFIKDTADTIIHDFYYNVEDPGERYAHDRFIDSIIVFSNEDEKTRFEEYASYHWNEYADKRAEMKIPNISTSSEVETLHYENAFRNVRLLQLIYKDFLLKESL